MKKLLELLNEFEKENGRNFEVKEIGMTYRNNDLMVISKRYGFIQWLVDNDKIDFEEYKNKSELYTLKVVHGTDYYIDLSTNKVNSDFLLMLLSIQDNPIDFLISILKDKKVRTVYVDEDGNVSGDTKRYTDC